MNLHLSLDVVAWVLGIFFGLFVVIGLLFILEGPYATKSEVVGFTIFGIIATICWAWIVAG